ncbi:tRNA (adenosine(37)-N6)-threonylcarbamoyltransferase complex dimerization subunit type 1 TsaB [Fibrobacterota bacterium]
MTERPTLTLLVDTSTSALLALFDNQGKCLDWKRGEDRFADTLDGMLQAILAKNTLQYSDIQAVMLARGPGSFTGLRVGIAFAQGLCFPGGIPIYPFTSFLPMMICLKDIGPGGSVIQAKQGYYYLSSSVPETPGYTSETLIPTRELLKLAPVLRILIVSGKSGEKKVLEEEYEKMISLEEEYPFGKLYTQIIKGAPAANGIIKANYVQMSAAEVRRRRTEDGGQ